MSPEPLESAKPCILIVDDEASLIRAVARRLEAAGYEVLTAGNGKEALHWLAQRRPDMVISDLMMPVMNGWELCHYLRSHENLRGIPVIMLSGSIDGFGPAGSLDECDFLMGKPFETERLLAKIKELLASKKQAPPNPS